MNYKTDAEYESYTISEIIEREPDYFELHLKDDHGGGGYGIGVKNENMQPVPNVGDEIKVFGKGFGFPVRGIVRGDTVYYYRTPEEEELHHEKAVQERKEQQKQDYVDNKEKYQADYNSLPIEFQQRIDGFRKFNKDFWWEFEPYELMVCKQAVLFSKHLKTQEDVQKFYEVPLEEKMKMVPELDSGHSGNSFGMACRLALLFNTRKDLIAKYHMSLCGLVGCNEAGCYAARPEGLLEFNAHKGEDNE